MHRISIFFLFLLVLSFNITAQSPEWITTGMPGYGRQVRCIYTDTLSNILYVTGEVLCSPTSFSNNYICRYNGSSWSVLGVFNDQVLSLTTYNGDLIASGVFTAINGVPFFSIARFDGVSWYPMGNFDVEVTKVKVINNDLYAMGYFNSVNGIPAKRIAKWNGNMWSDVNSFSTDTMDGHINDVVIYKGNIYVCGNFVNSTLGINHLAVYKEGAWQNVGEGIHGGFTDLAEFAVYKNELYLAGSILKPAGNVGHMIQKWNDTVWTEVGASVRDLSGGYSYATIRDMLIYENELYIAGGFGYAGNIPATFIAKWDGLKWCGYGTKALFTNGTGAQIGTAVGFYNDTLYLGIGNDTLNGVHTNRIIKYTYGNYVDTCSIEFTGIDQVPVNNGINVYPNPATNQITVESNLTETKNASLEIKNILGQTMLRQDLIPSEEKTIIDIHNLPSGIYFIELRNDKEVISKKLIKQD